MKTPSKATLKKWHGMTDENEHMDVRKEMAKYFGLKDFERAFDELIKARDQKPYGTYCLQAECLLTDAMFEKLDKSIVELIDKNQCL